MLESIERFWSDFNPANLATLLILPVLFAAFAVIKKAITEWAVYIVEGLIYWLSRVIRHSASSRLSLKRYAALALEQQNKYVHIPAKTDVSLLIDNIYVSLTLDRNGTSLAYSESTITDAADRIRVIGDPGSGKSSMMKKIFRDQCRASLKAPGKARFPFLIDLKAIAPPADIDDDRLGKWFFDKIKSQMHAHKIYKLDECFESYSATSGVLLLLDGLDEVSTTLYPRVENCITQLSELLSQHGPRNIIILTMRKQFHTYIGLDLIKHFSTLLSVQPFSNTDIFEFLNNWPYGSGQNFTPMRIFHSLTDRPALRDMCTNPLILSMYVAEFQAADGISLPETRALFYKRVVDELISRRRSHQLGITRLSFEDHKKRLLVLGTIACDNLFIPDQPMNFIHISGAIATTCSLLGCSEHEAAQWLRETAKETGLISEDRADETIRFIHLTFCEFLCALHMISHRASGWNEIIQTHRAFQASSDTTLKSRLREVIPFAAGLLPPYMYATVIEDSCRLDDIQLGAHVFLETKLYKSPAWASFFDYHINILSLQITPMVDDHWLADVNNLMVAYSDSLLSDGTSHEPQKAVLDHFFGKINSRGDDTVAKIIESYARHDAVAAFRFALLCNIDIVGDLPHMIIDHCDQPLFLAMCLDAALSQDSSSNFWWPLIAEASLKSSAVAATLKEQPPVEPLSLQVDSLPISDRWDCKGIIKRSSFTDIITMSHHIVRTSLSSERDREHIPFLDILSPMPPPASLKILRSGRHIMYFLVLPLCLVFGYGVMAMCSIVILYAVYLLAADYLAYFPYMTDYLTFLDGNYVFSMLIAVVSVYWILQALVSSFGLIHRGYKFILHSENNNYILTIVPLIIYNIPVYGDMVKWYVQRINMNSLQKRQSGIVDMFAGTYFYPALKTIRLLRSRASRPI